MTDKLRKCVDLKEELIRLWQLKRTCITPLVLSTMAIIPNKLHEFYSKFTVQLTSRHQLNALYLKKNQY
jgi:hypothetical protein